MAPPVRDLFDDVSLEELRRRRSEKWAKHPPDVLPSFYAEMDFPPAAPVTAALTAAIEAGDLGYAHSATSGLGAAFAGFAARRWGWEVDPAAVTAVPDVMVGVAELLRGRTAPGDGVVITTPVYPPFFSVIAETGRRPVEVPLPGPEAGAGLPVDGIGAALAAGARAVLLCNPHNPTGHVARREELEAVGELAARHGALVLSDEIHAPLTFDGAAHVPFASMPEPIAGRAITLTSASKGWNLAGLKCGIAVAASEEMRAALAGLPPDLSDRVGHLGVLASEAAFEAGEEWLDALLDYLAETRRRLPGLLADHIPGVRWRPGEATYLAWLDCRGLDLGDDPASAFLERGRVALASGPEFGAPGRGFARLNLGTSWALVEEAVRRMARAT
jgi:cysteine-S-conjugate beta-lyase